MARIAKLSMYLLDPDDHYGSGIGKGVGSLIENRMGLNILAAEAEEKQFDWDDDVLVNQFDCTVDDVEYFFDRLEVV